MPLMNAASGSAFKQTQFSLLNKPPGVSVTSLSLREPPDLPPLHAWCLDHTCMTPSGTSALLPLALTEPAHGVAYQPGFLSLRQYPQPLISKDRETSLRICAVGCGHPSVCLLRDRSRNWLSAVASDCLSWPAILPENERGIATNSLKPFRDWAYPQSQLHTGGGWFRW